MKSRNTALDPTPIQNASEMGTNNISNAEILATLRELSAKVVTPLWLFGGVAVDFLAGRWTRPHGDIDLNTLSAYRERLTRELHGIGYRTSDTGWLTHWFQDGTGRHIEVVFLERGADGATELRIRQGDPIGVPGRYPIVPNHLDPGRVATLNGVTFRVSSPEGEWLARASGMDVVGGRVPDPKLEQDRKVLESILPVEVLTALRSLMTKSKRAGNGLK